MAFKVCVQACCVHAGRCWSLTSCVCVLCVPQDNVSELKQKLDDSNKLLASNQQGTTFMDTLSTYWVYLIMSLICGFVVIAWLNKEINEAQIAHQRRATAHPSVLSFRPTADKVSL